LYKAILWDNDGVLVDTERFYFEANRRKLAELGVELTLEMYQQFFLLESRGAWHLLDGQGYSDEQIEGFKKERNQTYSELIDSGDVVVEGAPETLEQLSKHYFMAVVTSAYREHFERIHDRSGFKKYFKFVLANGEYGRSKPAPDPYLEALKKSGFQAEECIVVEDSERGLRSAHAAGIDCWIIRTEMTARSDFSFAKREFDNLVQVKEALLELANGAA